MRRLKSSRAGDVIEVSVSGGYAYLQFVGKRADSSDMLRAFVGIHPSPLPDVRAVNHLNESYTFLSATTVLLEDKRFRLIGNVPLIKPYSVPTFRSGFSKKGVALEVIDESFYVWPITDDYAELADCWIIPAKAVVERLSKAWKPKDDISSWVSMAISLAADLAYKDDEAAFAASFWQKIQEGRKELEAKILAYREATERAPGKEAMPLNTFIVFADFPNKASAIKARQHLEQFGYVVPIANMADNESGSETVELSVSINVRSEKDLKEQSELLESRLTSIADSLGGDVTGHEFSLHHK